MQRFWWSLGLITISTLALADDVASMQFVQPATESFALETPLARQSYALGVDMQRHFKNQGANLNTDAFLVGFKDASSQGDLKLGEDTMQLDLKEWQKGAMEARLKKQKSLSEENRKMGEKFLAENRQREGVVTLPSGLQYEVLKAGSGAMPKISDIVKVHYRGTLINGKEFDSSYARGTPAVFPVSGVIPGWTEALQKMSVGSQWKLVIPSNLAYGDQSVGPDIGPNSTLVFEVELLAINP